MKKILIIAMCFILAVACSACNEKKIQKSDDLNNVEIIYKETGKVIRWDYDGNVIYEK